MTSLSMLIVAVFVIGYFFIAIESVTKVNKAAIALLMFVGCWTIFMCDPSQYLSAAIGDKIPSVVNEAIEHHLGSTATTLFFLMGAMTIVELVDQNGGFNFVRDTLKTKSKKALLWRIAFMTFILSAILDNLTTSIVMIMILRKLVSDHKDRIIYAALVVIAANSGGAFSPIGDVTTIMLWNKGVITALGVIKEIIVPSIVSMVIPAYILSFSLKGELALPEEQGAEMASSDFTDIQRKTVFFLGVGGLIFVPIFKSITHLPPFVGILLVLGLLWTVTELFYSHLPKSAKKSTMQKRVSNMLSRIDMSTILFFLGILMAVACLETIGVLTQLGNGLNVVFEGNHYLVTGIIGVLFEHRRQRASRSWLHGYVSCRPKHRWRHVCRRYLLAAACLLCRRWRFYAHHRFCCRCGCNGSREDNIRLVYEEGVMDCLRRLSRRYHSILGGEKRYRSVNCFF